MIKLIHNLMFLISVYQFFHMEFCIPYYSIVLFLWIIYKNECVISFYDKVNNIDGYKLGDNGTTPDLFVSDIDFRIDRILCIVVIPIYYYILTKDLFSSMLLFINIFTCASNIWFCNEFLKTRFRYILIPLMMYVMTNSNLIKSKTVNVLFFIGIAISLSLMIYTLLNYNNENEIFEISIIGIVSLIYLLYTNVKNIIN